MLNGQMVLRQMLPLRLAHDRSSLKFDLQFRHTRKLLHKFLVVFEYQGGQLIADSLKLLEFALPHVFNLPNICGAKRRFKKS